VFFFFFFWRLFFFFFGCGCFFFFFWLGAGLPDRFLSFTDYPPPLNLLFHPYRVSAFFFLVMRSVL